MKFVDRTRETASLQTIQKQSLKHAQFTVLTGRRRIGKTSLVFHAYKDMPFLYFFVSKKSESELCAAYQQEISAKLGIPMLGRVMRFADIFEYIIQLSKRQPITLFIDEFQEFMRINASVYSDMQRIWDINKEEARINLIVGGSVQTMIHQIFENKKEPLYNRQTAMMRLKKFPPSILKEILASHNPNYSSDDLLALYSFTGGVAKYVELLMDNGATTKDQMIEAIIQPDSVFLSEGKNLLIEEFGKDYGVYFSILTAIASGHSQRSRIEDIIGKEIGGYLTMLEDTYGLISKHKPLFATANSNIRYRLDDNFLIFWFRFVFKYNYMLEIDAFEALRQIIRRDYETFSGKMLENYFKEKLAEEQQFTRIDNWWSRNGETEIDIIAINELTKQAAFYEVKRQAKELDSSTLDTNVNEFLIATRQLKKYSISYFGLSM
ncbi:MAG: ATP-binding protein, partial [Paludibacteraceae bacterium]|nr:ATP-binding protein [Paludibacteraceae bacterium]